MEPPYRPSIPNCVNLDAFGRGAATVHVRYASNSDQGGDSQRNVAKCQQRTSPPLWLRQTLPYLTLSQHRELALGVHNNWSAAE
jgi:hypothetical protein